MTKINIAEHLLWGNQGKSNKYWLIIITVYEEDFWFRCINILYPRHKVLSCDSCVTAWRPSLNPLLSYLLGGMRLYKLENYLELGIFLNPICLIRWLKKVHLMEEGGENYSRPLLNLWKKAVIALNFPYCFKNHVIF